MTMILKIYAHFLSMSIINLLIIMISVVQGSMEKRTYIFTLIISLDHYRFFFFTTYECGLLFTSLLSFLFSSHHSTRLDNLRGIYIYTVIYLLFIDN
jgi:hypothetical protein